MPNTKTSTVITFRVKYIDEIDGREKLTDPIDTIIEWEKIAEYLKSIRCIGKMTLVKEVTTTTVRTELVRDLIF